MISAVIPDQLLYMTWFINAKIPFTTLYCPGKSSLPDIARESIVQLIMYHIYLLLGTTDYLFGDSVKSLLLHQCLIVCDCRCKLPL